MDRLGRTVQATWLVGLSLATSACVTPVVMQTPRTLARGETTLAIVPENQTALGRSGATSYPAFDAAFAFGVADGVDLAVVGGAGGLHARTKVRAFDRGPWAAALSLSGGGGYFSVGGASSAFLGLDVGWILGRDVGGGHTFVLATRVVDAVLFGNHGKAMNVLGVGLGVGLVLRVTRGFAVQPELSVLEPLGARDAVAGAGGGNLGDAQTKLMFAAAVGFVVGSGVR